MIFVFFDQLLVLKMLSRSKWFFMQSIKTRRQNSICDNNQLKQCGASDFQHKHKLHYG